MFFRLCFRFATIWRIKKKILKLDKMNSHLKIIPMSQSAFCIIHVEKMYLGDLDKIGCNLDKNRALKYFVEMLDKKIGRYNNG